MGGSNYNFADREVRTRRLQTQSINQIFEQNIKRAIHELMKPQNAKLRESRDSDNHPNSVPIIMGLDVTGSMGHIPEHLIKEGLPTLMAGIIGAGIPDPQVLFLGIGDHKHDNAPLQVGQFESGDAELDMWLQRVWLEGGGGGNGGESYHLAWYFAALHTVHDAWEKRGRKGFLFTIGDEPCHGDLPGSVTQQLMGLSERPDMFVFGQLLHLARERYHVYHININHGQGSYVQDGWKKQLGEYALEVTDYREIPALIARIVSSVESSAMPLMATRAVEIDYGAAEAAVTGRIQSTHPNESNIPQEGTDGHNGVADQFLDGNSSPITL